MASEASGEQSTALARLRVLMQSNFVVGGRPALGVVIVEAQWLDDLRAALAAK